MIVRSNLTFALAVVLLARATVSHENRAVEMSAAWLRLTHASFAAMTFGKDFCELGSEQKNLCRIIDPQQKNDQTTCGSKAGSHCTASNIPANEGFSDGE